MKWITREKIRVDRVACSWLIRNFVDREAEFVFVPNSTDWSQIADAGVFDVPDCELGHHDEDVSFNWILKKYDLTSPRFFSLAKSLGRPIRIHRIRIRPMRACAGSLRASARSASPITKFSSASSLFMMLFTLNACDR